MRSAATLTLHTCLGAVHLYNSTPLSLHPLAEVRGHKRDGDTVGLVIPEARTRGVHARAILLHDNARHCQTS
jgi:hypothetical protein